MLRDAFGHHAWATTRLLSACLPLTDEQLATLVPGTFGTVIDTLRHLVGADCSYLWVLTGGEVHRLDDEDTADVARLLAVSEGCGPAWERLLSRDLDPAAYVVRHRDDGISSGAPLGIRLAQVVHHGTDHRSQACTALTVLGIEPPEIDVWSWADSQGRLWERPTAQA